MHQKYQNIVYNVKETVEIQRKDHIEGMSEDIFSLLFKNITEV